MRCLEAPFVRRDQELMRGAGTREPAQDSRPKRAGACKPRLQAGAAPPAHDRRQSNPAP